MRRDGVRLRAGFMMRLVILIWAMASGAVQAQDAPRIGIFGTVSQVAPLVVAGRAVNWPAAVPLLNVLGAGGDVAEGDTLALVVRAQGGELIAERMLQVFGVIGPVGDVMVERISVMRTDVHRPPGRDVAQGDWVAVSGLWSGQSLITSGLRVVEPSGFAQLTGVVEEGAVGGTALLDAVPPQGGFGSGPWIFGGAPEVSGLRVDLMSRGVFGGPVDLVLWQGYASPPIASQTYEIYGSGIIGTARDAQMPAAGALITRCARQGRVIAVPPTGLEDAFAALGCEDAPAEP